jgi:ribosome biogenesis protein ERB1
LASGSDDGSLKVWEVSTGRCSCSWQLGEPVVCVGWCPNPDLQLLAAAVGNKLVLLPVGVVGEEAQAAAAAACQVG